MDSMRERTIAALVELFKEKERSLQNWQDPRFQPKAEGQESGVGSIQTSFGRSPEDLTNPSEERNEANWRSNNESNARPWQIELTETTAARNDRETSQRVPESRFKIPKLEEPVRLFSNVPVAQSKSSEANPKTSRLPDVKPFDQITPPPKADFQQLVERKMEERSDDLWNSELKTISIAQIKKYLYQEEYELCALELEKIRNRFPHNSAIQAFVDNTSKRLTELQRMKSFGTQARELMLSASCYYQAGKLPEALMAAKEVLRIFPDHPQTKEFIDSVEKQLEKEKKKGLGGKTHYCWSCGIAVDPVSRFCFHCGHRLS